MIKTATAISNTLNFFSGAFRLRIEIVASNLVHGQRIVSQKPRHGQNSLVIKSNMTDVAILRMVLSCVLYDFAKIWYAACGGTGGLKLQCSTN